MLHFLMLHYLLLCYLLLHHVNVVLFSLVLFNVWFYMYLVSCYSRSSVKGDICPSKISCSTNDIKLKITLLVFLDKRCCFLSLLWSCDPCVCASFVCVSESPLWKKQQNLKNDTITQLLLPRWVTCKRWYYLCILGFSTVFIFPCKFWFVDGFYYVLLWVTNIVCITYYFNMCKGFFDVALLINLKGSLFNNDVDSCTF